MADKLVIMYDQENHPVPMRAVDNGDGSYALKTDVALTVADEVTIDTGAAITGESLEAGGSGLLGWLSSLRKKIADRLPAALGAGGGLKVDGSGTALPVSASSLPLPAGAALETGGNLAAILAKLSSDPATQTTLAAILAKLISAPATAALQGGGLPAALAAGGGLKVEGVANGVAQPVTESGGAYTTPTHTAVTVGVATGEALAANVNRLYALLVNDSDTVIYIKLGAAAVLNAGIRLNANGGSYEMSKNFGNLYTGAINAIASAASKNLIVTEGV